MSQGMSSFLWIFRISPTCIVKRCERTNMHFTPVLFLPLVSEGVPNKHDPRIRFTIALSSF